MSFKDLTWVYILLFLSLLKFSDLTAQCGPFSVNTNGATTDEAEAFELINRFRADPQGELARIFNDITGGNYTKTSLAAILNSGPNPPAGWWTSTFGSNIVFNSMDYFGTVPSVVQSQWDALPSAGILHPYVWDDNIGWASLQYATCVENYACDTCNVHAIPGAPTLGARFTDSGYTSWNTVGENIAPDWPNNSDYMHAGFAIDWGGGPNGIQNPPGHRNSMLSSTFTEIGIGIIDDGWTSGEVSQVQHLGKQFADRYLSGYVYLSPATSYSYDDAGVGTLVTLKTSSGTAISTYTSGQFGEYVFDMTGEPNGTYTLEVPSGGPCGGGGSSTTSYTVNYTGPGVLVTNLAAGASGNLNLSGIQQSTADYESNGMIISTQTIQSNPNNPTAPVAVDYDSANRVRLMPGFRVHAGPVFKAFIDGCGGSQ